MIIWVINTFLVQLFCVLCLCAVLCLTAQSCLILFSPQAPLAMGILHTRILEWVAMLSSNPGIEPRCLALQVDSLPGSPKRTMVVLIALVSTYITLVVQGFKTMWTFVFSNLFTGGTVHSAESYGNTVVGVSVAVLGVWQTTQKGNQSTQPGAQGCFRTHPEPHFHTLCFFLLCKFWEGLLGKWC